tara:strand:+ start:1548 stop:1844 length:297 start_codon:yes stop_codon:yes gene_type:complete
MKTIQDTHTEKPCKCSICSEQLLRYESAIVVLSDGNQVKAYCDHHRLVDILANHPDIDLSQSEQDEERHLRQMEDYGAYRASGSTANYWTDRDAGYCN